MKRRMEDLPVRLLTADQMPRSLPVHPPPRPLTQLASLTDVRVSDPPSDQKEKEETSEFKHSARVKFASPIFRSTDVYLPLQEAKCDWNFINYEN